jgi:phosphate starvation-inducible PhoH-like protein
MKMFVTRLGFNSKAVITGDVTQIDLPNARRSGLLEAAEVLKNVEGLAFAYFDDTDVVRHQLVQRIIRAYDEHKAKAAEQLPLLDSRTNGKAHGGDLSLGQNNADPSSQVDNGEVETSD